MLEAIWQGGSARKLRLFAVYLARERFRNISAPDNVASLELVELAERATLNRVRPGDAERGNFLRENQDRVMNGAWWLVEDSAWLAATLWWDAIIRDVEPRSKADYRGFALSTLRILFPDPTDTQICPGCNGDRTVLFAEYPAGVEIPKERTRLVDLPVMPTKVERGDCPGCKGVGRISTLAILKAWRTPQVIGVARQMDDTGDFSAMPILADALEDAGCEDERILKHCRGWKRCPDCNEMSSVHCVDGWVPDWWGRTEEPSAPFRLRGDWVIDLCLGLE